MKKLLKNNFGFNLLEVIVSISLFIIIVLLINSLFLVSQKSFTSGTNRGELTQNIRVVVDRLSRELRQAAAIATTLPASSSTPVNEILFEDGHDISEINYIRYYLNGSDIKREYRFYYYASAPATHVRWNSIDGFGNSPTASTTEDYIVGQYLSSMQFWGTHNLINIKIELLKAGKTSKIETAVNKRN